MSKTSATGHKVGRSRWEAVIGMTGFCHRGDHHLCQHTGQDPTTWRSSGRSDDPGFGAYPDCACACHVGPTGYCSVGKHNRCKYGPGRQFPDGIVLSDGKRERVYMCPCQCHGQPTPNQPSQLDGAGAAAATAARRRHSATPWTTAEMRLIQDNLHLSNAEIAAQLGRTPDAIKHKRRALSEIADW